MTGVLDTSDSFERCFDEIDNLLQVGTRIHQPDLRFHGNRVAAFLNDT